MRARARVAFVRSRASRDAREIDINSRGDSEAREAGQEKEEEEEDGVFQVSVGA